MSGEIHIVDAGGRGGVYQHAVAVVDALARDGRRVVLHTATDAELEPGPDVRLCRCVHWHRDFRGPLRGPAIALSWIFRTVPHLARAVRRGDVFHFQGEFKPLLTTPTLALMRLLPGRRVVQSRHNTFTRSQERLGAALLRIDLRVAHSTIVFSRADVERVEALGGRPVLAPLAQHSPPVDAAAIEHWRARWAPAAGRPVVLFAGQIRPDKRLDLAIEAAARLPVDLAVVGEDKGDLDRCRALADKRGLEVSWTTEYVPLDDFVAALAAADVVVCPYDRASQSGVLALARKVGARTVASDVGGLAELATATAPPGDGVELARSIEEVLALEGGTDDMETGLIAAHLEAYGMSEETR